VWQPRWLSVLSCGSVCRSCVTVTACPASTHTALVSQSLVGLCFAFLSSSSGCEAADCTPSAPSAGAAGGPPWPAHTRRRTRPLWQGAVASPCSLLPAPRSPRAGSVCIGAVARLPCISESGGGAAAAADESDDLASLITGVVPLMARYQLRGARAHAKSPKTFAVPTAQRAATHGLRH